MTNMFQFWAGIFPKLFGGLIVSLELTALSLLIGLPLGLLLALGVSSRFKPLSWLSIALVEIGRGAPALVVLYVVYFGLPALRGHRPRFCVRSSDLPTRRRPMPAIPARQAEISQCGTIEVARRSP